jgi:hypothetical protein
MVMTLTPNKDSNGFAELRRLGDDMPAVDEAAKARARARLDEEIRRERVRPRPHVIWRPIAAAATVVLVAVASWALLERSIDRPARQEPPLLRLAAVAATQPPPSVPAGSFVYTSARVRASVTSTNIATGATETVTVESRRETWIAADGSGLILERPVQAGSGETKRIRADPGKLRFTNLDQLPTEPQALLDAIMRPGFLDEPDDDLEILAGIGVLLRDSYVDPAHREGLFLIVERIHGVEVEENHRDPLGRLGTAVTLRDSTRSVMLVFQARSSRLLAERETRADGTFFEATYLQTAVVRAVGERPAETGT